MRIHTGDRPFACPYCDFRSLSSGALGRHKKKNHHPQWQREEREKQMKKVQVSTHLHHQPQPDPMQLQQQQQQQAVLQTGQIVQVGQVIQSGDVKLTIVPGDVKVITAPAGQVVQGSCLASK